MIVCLAIVGGIILLAVLVWDLSRNRSSRVVETEIFEGVWYGCQILPPTEEGSGPVHWVRVDLTAPGVGVFITPTDRTLDGSEYQYRHRRTATVARAEKLAITINGSLFIREPSILPGYRSGQRARGVETVVSNSEVSHQWEHTYLLWFDADRMPALERRKPPPAIALARAKWGIGGQGIGLVNGRVATGLDRSPAARTAIGIDATKKLLFLAVFESTSPRGAMEELAKLGAQDGMLLDGGGSTSMVIGESASGVHSGTVLGGWRPVATHFGVRANPKRP